MLLHSLILYLLFVCTCFAILHAIISSKLHSCPFSFSVPDERRPSGPHLHWCIPRYCTVDTFTIFHCYFFLPFIHPCYLFVYHFISSLIFFPFCFCIDLLLWYSYFAFQAFHTLCDCVQCISLVPCTCSINTSRVHVYSSVSYQLQNPILFYFSSSHLNSTFW